MLTLSIQQTVSGRIYAREGLAAVERDVAVKGKGHVIPVAIADDPSTEVASSDR